MVEEKIVLKEAHSGQHTFLEDIKMRTEKLDDRGCSSLRSLMAENHSTENTRKRRFGGSAV